MARLPEPGGDAGNWGEILNDFLRQEHNDDGSLKADETLATKADASALADLSDTVDTKAAAADVTALDTRMDVEHNADGTSKFRRQDQSGLIAPNSGAARLLPFPRIMDTPPTIDVPDQVIGIIDAVLVKWNDPRLRIFRNGIKVGGDNFPDYNYGIREHAGCEGYVIEFVLDSDAFEMWVKGTGPWYRVLVDGQFASVTGQGGPSLPSDGSSWYIRYAFADARPRVIRVECSPNAYVGGFYVAPTAGVFPSTTPRGPRVAVMGDSFTEAGGGRSFAHYIGYAIGWLDIWATGEGGTGYVNPGPQEPWARVKFRDRVQEDVIDHNPDVVVVAGGINDSSYTTAEAVGDEAGLLFAQIRLLLPHAPLIAVGPWWPRNTPTVTIVQVRDQVREKVIAAGRLFVDNIGGPVPYSGTIGDYSGKGWITGNGKEGSPTGDGNADRYTSADGTHPTNAGQAYLGYRVASAIAAAMPL